jgi:hypothetical protein
VSPRSPFHEAPPARALPDERLEPPAPTLGELGGLAVAEALAALGSAPGGLSTTEARGRRRV